MKMSQAFPSKYLKAADLDGGRFTLTMSHITMEKVVDDEPEKPILYFNGAQKGMVINQTNGMMIASLYGDDTDHWPGRPVELYTAMVSFGGKTVPAIRVMAPAQAMPAHQSGPLGGQQEDRRPVHNAPDPNAPQGGGGYAADPLNDEVPFAPCIH